MNFSVSNIIAGVVFGVFGWSSFSYGRKLGFWKPMVIGIAMMGYSYFLWNDWLVWFVGVALTVLLWFHHDE